MAVHSRSDDKLSVYEVPLGNAVAADPAPANPAPANPAADPAPKAVAPVVLKSRWAIDGKATNDQPRLAFDSEGRTIYHAGRGTGECRAMNARTGAILAVVGSETKRIGLGFHPLARGRVVMKDDVVTAEPGSARFLPRGPYDFIRPRGVLPNGFDAASLML